MKMEKTTCCIAGGGPAGVMLGLLLARQGVEVLVLEKHKDFFRDFRGDTVHPSTLEVVRELGLIDEFLKLPHTRLEEIEVEVSGASCILADFTRLPGSFQYIAFMPQWDFLEFLVRQARSYPNFRLVHGVEVTDVLEKHGRIIGVGATTPEGRLEVHAELVVGADGRHSAVRRCAQMPSTASPSPVDVLWFRLSRKPNETLTHFRAASNSAVITIDRGEYWQIAFVIPKNGLDATRSDGLAALRKRMATLFPELGDRVEELVSWDEVKLLDVRVDRLLKWYKSGLLCIGDAAHAMSPAGGVGINLAVQDAVAAANLLGPALRRGSVSVTDLMKVQKRREFPTRVTQAFQVRLLRDLYPNGVPRSEDSRPPFGMRVLKHFPSLRHWTARFIGLGVRPEHVSAA